MSEATPPPPPSTPEPPAPVNYPDPTTYAPWGRRVLAYVVDYIPIAILWVIAWWMYNLSFDSYAASLTADADGSNLQVQSSQFEPGFAAGVPLAILAIVIGIIYWLWNRVWKMGVTGSSIGMGVVGTKAVKETTGEPLGVGLNLLRQILLAVDFWICYVGVLWPLWDSKRQCLISDKATGAVVLPTK